MNTVSHTMKNDALVVALEGKIVSANAGELQDEVDAALKETGAAAITFDAANLEYISSSGLRIVMRPHPRCTRCST